MTESRKKGKKYKLESVLDLNSKNIWDYTETDIASRWEKERLTDDFTSYEEKILNVIRLAFEVVHYNVADPRDLEKYEKGGWAHFSHCHPSLGNVAIRRKTISRITDLTYENVKHITSATLLELINRNFGGGWESISLPLRDVIESGFDISTTQLPASRIHAPGGTLERKVAQGFDVLEIPKGTWVEAIFAKKKEEMPRWADTACSPRDDDFSKDSDYPVNDDSEVDFTQEKDEDEDQNLYDETFYSSYAQEADSKSDLDE